MASLLAKVKTKLYIVAHRRTWGLLDGEYSSVFRGRSLDYDDLREYVPGDEIRDIDWKATARYGSPLVKRYVATRKQTVLLVVDTGRSMAAAAPSGEAKKDVGIMVAGMLAYLAIRHGDYVGLVEGDSADSRLHEAKGTEAHLERLLRTIDRHTTPTAAASRFTDQLRYLAEHVRKRCLVLVIADDRALGPDDTPLLRRLHAQHEILWVTVDDADPTEFQTRSDAVEMRDLSHLPAAVRGSGRLHAAYRAAVQQQRAQLDAQLGSLAITRARVGSTRAVVTTVFALLERQRRRVH